MKLILTLSLIVILGGCGYIPAPADIYCTEQCSVHYGQPTEGQWLGDDDYINATRCVCFNSEWEMHHLFPKRNKDGNKKRKKDSLK
jgi:hypothetical protein